MAEKARRKSSTAAPVSPQLIDRPGFPQQREHGQSPEAARENLIKAIRRGAAFPNPRLPRGWQLGADGDEVFGESPEARLDARGFSLEKPDTSPCLAPIPVPPEVAARFYPSGWKPPKQRRAAPRQQSASLLERAQARLNELSSLSAVWPPVDPEIVVALKQLPPNSPPCSSRSSSPKPAASGPLLRLRAQRDSREKWGKPSLRSGATKSVTGKASHRMSRHRRCGG